MLWRYIIRITRIPKSHLLYEDTEFAPHCHLGLELNIFSHLSPPLPCLFLCRLRRQLIGYQCSAHESPNGFDLAIEGRMQQDSQAYLLPLVDIPWKTE